MKKQESVALPVESDLSRLEPTTLAALFLRLIIRISPILCQRVGSEHEKPVRKKLKDLVSKTAKALASKESTDRVLKVATRLQLDLVDVESCNPITRFILHALRVGESDCENPVALAADQISHSIECVPQDSREAWISAIWEDITWLDEQPESDDPIEWSTPIWPSEMPSFWTLDSFTESLCSEIVILSPPVFCQQEAVATTPEDLLREMSQLTSELDTVVSDAETLQIPGSDTVSESKIAEELSSLRAKIRSITEALIVAGHLPKPKESLTILRDRIRAVVQSSGLSYAQIGEKMGYTPEVSRASITRLLSANANRDPSLSTLIKLANALGCSVADLLG